MTPDRFHLAGVMGDPISHSRSPHLHNYWLARHGLKGSYLPLHVRPAKLETALRALPTLGFAGVNLTIPHKEAALAIVDEATEAARRIGAINCVTVRPDGSLHGANHDGFGYFESLLERAPDFRPEDGPILVLGAGGGARAVVHGLAERGAREIRLANRSRERAERMAAEFGAPLKAIDWAEREAALADCALLVNTTSLGMKGQPPLEMPLGSLPAHALVSDIVYSPLETPLLAAARARGHIGVDGLGMLIHQARPAFEGWFGVMPEATAELRAKLEATIPG